MGSLAGEASRAPRTEKASFVIAALLRWEERAVEWKKGPHVLAGKVGAGEKRAWNCVWRARDARPASGDDGKPTPQVVTG